MKTVNIELPVQEAVELIRLARGETRCLIENTDHMPDWDIVKRTQLVLSARERICTALEGVAETEEEVFDPAQIALSVVKPAYKAPTPMDAALEAATTGSTAPLAAKHGVKRREPEPTPHTNYKDDRYWDGLYGEFLNEVQPALPLADSK